MPDSIDQELSNLLDGGKPSSAPDIEAIKDQVKGWLEECKGDLHELLKKVIDDSAASGDHLVLLRTRCSPSGHSETEVYGANAGAMDMLEMLVDSTHQMVVGTRHSAASFAVMAAMAEEEESEDEDDGEDGGE